MGTAHQTKVTDDAGSESPAEAQPAPEAVEPSTQDASKTPIWKTLSNRVSGAMWKHLQNDGTARFTIAISRSYYDQKKKAYQNVHYFDSSDLEDVKRVVDQASAYVQST